MKIESGKNRRVQNDVIAGVARTVHGGCPGGVWFVYELNGDKIRFMCGIKWVIRCENCGKCM